MLIQWSTEKVPRQALNCVEPPAASESSKNNKDTSDGLCTLDDSKGSLLDDGIRPEDAIDEQVLKQRVPRKPKKKTKKLPSYDTRQILSYGFRLDAPPDGEQAVGFMLLPDGTLAAIPIAPHMFLTKPKITLPEPETVKEEDTVEGPKTPEDIVSKPGPKTPDDSELEEGEVSESDNEDKAQVESDTDHISPLKNLQNTEDKIDDEVDGIPFNILEDGYHTDEDKASSSASSLGSSPTLPSPDVSDEDPQTIAERNVNTWQENYNTAANELDGEEMVEQKYSDSSSSSEEGELSDEDGKPQKTGMTGLASYLDKFSDNTEDKNMLVQDKEDKSEYEQFYPPGYLDKAKEKKEECKKDAATRPSKPAYLMGSNITDDSAELSKNTYHRLDEQLQSINHDIEYSGFDDAVKSPEITEHKQSREYFNPAHSSCVPNNGVGPPEYRPRDQSNFSGGDHEYRERNMYFRKASEQDAYFPEPFRSPKRYQSPSQFQSSSRPQSQEHFQSTERFKRPLEEFSSSVGYDPISVTRPQPAWYQKSPPHSQVSPARNRMMLPPPRNAQQSMIPRAQHQSLLPPSHEYTFPQKRQQSPPPIRNRQISPPPRNYQLSPPPGNYQMSPPPRYRNPSPSRRQSPPSHTQRLSPHQERRMSPPLRQRVPVSYKSRPPPPPPGYYGQLRPYRHAGNQRPAHPPPRHPPVPRPRALDLSNYTARPLYIDKEDDVIDDYEESLPDEYQSKNHFLGVSPRFIPLQVGGSGGIIEQLACMFSITHFTIQCAFCLCFFSVLLAKLKLKHKIDALYPKLNPYISKLSRNLDIYVYVVGKQNNLYEPPVPRFSRSRRQVQIPQEEMQVLPVEHQPYEDRTQNHNEQHQLAEANIQTYYSEEIMHAPESYTFRGTSPQQRRHQYQEQQTYVSENEEQTRISGEPHRLSRTHRPTIAMQQDSGLSHFHKNDSEYDQRHKLLDSGTGRNDMMFEPDPETSNSQIYYRDDSSDEDNFHPPVQQYASTSTYIRPNPYQQPIQLDNQNNVKRSRKRTRTESSNSESEEDNMSESSNDLSNSTSIPIRSNSVPFADLPAPKIKYSKDIISAKPFSDIPVPKIGLSPAKGIHSSKFKPFDIELFDEKHKFKPTMQECEEPKFSSYPKSIISMLKEVDNVTSIDKIIASYGGDIPLETSEEGIGSSILQSIFGGESRLAPDYEEIDEKELSKLEVERLRKQLHEEREKSKQLEKVTTFENATSSKAIPSKPYVKHPTDSKSKKKGKRGKDAQIKRKNEDKKLLNQPKNSSVSQKNKTVSDIHKPKQPVNDAMASGHSYHIANVNKPVPSTKNATSTSAKIVTTRAQIVSSTTTTSNPTVQKTLEPEMEEKRRLVLEKIAEWKKQNEQEKADLLKMVKSTDKSIQDLDKKDPKNEIFERQKEAAWKTAQQYSMKKATNVKSSVGNSKITNPTIIPTASNSNEPLTVSNLPSFYQTAIYGASATAQNMQPASNYQPGLGASSMGMMQQGYIGMNPGMGYGNSYNMVQPQMGPYNQFPNHMMGSYDEYGYQQNVMTAPQMWPRQFDPRFQHQLTSETDSQPPAPGTEPISHAPSMQNTGTSSGISSTKIDTSLLPNTSSVVMKPPAVHKAHVSASAPTFFVSGTKITSAMRNKDPGLWSNVSSIAPTAAVTNTSSVVKTRPSNISKIHKLQLATAKNIKEITVGGHGSIKPLPQPTVEIDHEKMRKALQIKQKLDQSIKAFQKIKETGRQPIKNRFDMTPDEVELQKTKTHPICDLIDGTEPTKSIALDPAPGVDLDDIDNLVDHKTAELDLDF